MEDDTAVGDCRIIDELANCSKVAMTICRSDGRLMRRTISKTRWASRSDARSVSLDAPAMASSNILLIRVVMIHPVNFEDYTRAIGRARPMNIITPDCYTSHHHRDKYAHDHSRPQSHVGPPLPPIVAVAVPPRLPHPFTRAETFEQDSTMSARLPGKRHDRTV